ncbi:hypothetical protein J6590_030088 [Homalodisca vitripennis]|nr:hypothetical protein J6590_030088 [Homalodisca vitripennis]
MAISNGCCIKGFAGCRNFPQLPGNLASGPGTSPEPVYEYIQLVMSGSTERLRDLLA